MSGLVQSIRERDGQVLALFKGGKNLNLGAANRVETRTNAGSVVADNTVIFDFTNLTAGKRYRIHLSAEVEGSDDSGLDIFIGIYHNAGGTLVTKLGRKVNFAVASTELQQAGLTVDIPSLVGTAIEIKLTNDDVTNADVADIHCTLIEINNEVSATFGT